jgi:hypothetical protein
MPCRCMSLIGDGPSAAGTAAETLRLHVAGSFRSHAARRLAGPAGGIRNRPKPSREGRHSARNGRDSGQSTRSENARTLRSGPADIAKTLQQNGQGTGTARRHTSARKTFSRRPFRGDALFSGGEARARTPAPPQSNSGTCRLRRHERLSVRDAAGGTERGTGRPVRRKMKVPSLCRFHRSTILREESPGVYSGEESRPPSPDLTAAGRRRREELPSDLFFGIMIHG